MVRVGLGNVAIESVSMSHQNKTALLCSLTDDAVMMWDNSTLVVDCGETLYVFLMKIC